MNPKDSIETHFRLKTEQKKALAQLGLKTLRDLLYYFPTRYNHISEIKNIADLQEHDEAVLYGKVLSTKASKSYRSNIAIGEALIEDETGKIKATWFNQPYAAQMLKEGQFVKLTGKITKQKNGGLYLANPEFEQTKELPIDAGFSLFSKKGAALPDIFAYGIYPERRGINSRWFYHAIQKIISHKIPEQLTDSIPAEILKKYNLPKLQTALVWIHMPKKESDAEAARKRFAFEEIFFIQLARQRARFARAQNPSYIIERSEDALGEFLARFDFALTGAQDAVIEQIRHDFSKNEPMARLLEGDVGSGKTAVAAATAFSVVSTRPSEQDFGNLQVAYMAPTEILATQLYESFIEYFAHLPIKIGLITGSGCRIFPSKVNPETWTKISRAQLLKWVANGEVPILIGTHALIQKTVQFKHLAYVIIDEQHRFGVNQRAALMRGEMQTVVPLGTMQKDADSHDKLLYRDLSYKLRGILITVRKSLGLGHKESVYQKALAIALKKENIPYEQEKQIPIHYEGEKVGVYQPDFIIDKTILLELKALPRTATREKMQTWNYLKGSTYKVAFLANFGAKNMEIERFVYDEARGDCPHPSASCLHPSAEQVRAMPHLLSMTATPIPRTLALTIYGDLDLSLLDEMPAGRKRVITEVVPPSKREETYEKIEAEIKNGRQAYVVCARIDEPDPEKERALRLKSVKEEAARLKKNIFPKRRIEILHGKMTPKEKEEVMQEFAAGEIDILVATSVVEVGVNVPNATVILIEGAERFGLAQLHQLRGRVLRSEQQAYCYLFTSEQSSSKQASERLKALTQAKNGFELAELDLGLRGAGELAGNKQWGISDIGMEAIKNIKMVEAARTEAKNILEKDPDLSAHPELMGELTARKSEIHFE